MIQENLVNFKKGTYIIIENDFNNDAFFILLKGAVRVESSINSAGILDLNRNLRPGDFFGVIPFMTGNPQNESVYATEDSVLIRVNKSELPKMLTRSAALAIKIVRSFSEDLRVYDEKLVQLTLNQDHREDDLEEKLFSNAKFYYENKHFRIAAYILMQFIKVYPDSENIKEVTEMFSNIEAENIITLQNLKNGARRMYVNGQMLISEFEPGYEAFIIETGKVKITKIINHKEVLLAVLKPGDIFGEMAIINNQARAASAVAYGDTTCLVLNEKNFSKMIEQNTSVCIKIITLLSERIWTIYKQLENLTFKNVKTRIYDTLYTQMIKRKARIGPQVKFLFDFGTAELQKMVGIEQGEFEQAIKEVLGQKFLTLHEGKFLCLDTMDIKKETDFMKKIENIQGKKFKR